MRVLVFSLIVGVAFATPQGYNYQAQHATNGNGHLSGTKYKQSQSQSQLQPPEQQLTGTNPHIHQQQSPMQYTPTNYQPTNAPTTQQYNKEFYYLSAPPESLQLPHSFQDQLKNRKKNIRVIFIKSPENNGLANAALQLTKEAQSSKTAIYVLTKQHNAAELSNKLQQPPSRVQEKPEVVFIKYRTRAEAKNAQSTIQKQYEKLKVPSRIGFQIVALTHNFVGSAASKIGLSGAAKGVATASPNYLPPTERIKHFFS